MMDLIPLTHSPTVLFVFLLVFLLARFGIVSRLRKAVVIMVIATCILGPISLLNHIELAALYKGDFLGQSEIELSPLETVYVGRLSKSSAISWC